MAGCGCGPDTRRVLLRRTAAQPTWLVYAGAWAFIGALSWTTAAVFLVREAGLSPLQALQSATRNPADYFGRPGSGSVRRGAPADLLLLGANPLHDIRNLQEIRSVVLAGRYLSRKDLDRLIAGEQARAR